MEIRCIPRSKETARIAEIGKPDAKPAAVPAAKQTINARRDGRWLRKDDPKTVRKPASIPIELDSVKAAERAANAKRDRRWLLKEEPKAAKMMRKIAGNIRVRDDCWIWMGPVRGKNGIPYVIIDRKFPTAVRHYLLKVYTGFASEGTRMNYVTCGNDRCVRPSHSIRTGILLRYDMDDYDAIVMRVIQAAKGSTKDMRKLLTE